MTGIFEKLKRTGVASTVLASTLVTPTNAIEPKKYKNKEPFVATQMLREDSMPGKDSHESIVFSIQRKNMWLTAAENGDADRIDVDAFISVYKQVGGRPGRTENVVSQHNHSFDMMKAFAHDFMLDKEQITEPDLLLSGPSFYDCAKERPELLGYKFNTTNVVVEPGGYWVCSNLSQDALEALPNNVEEELISLRRDLIVKSQQKNPKARQFAITDFENKFENLMGIKVRYLPPNVSKEEYYKSIHEFYK